MPTLAGLPTGSPKVPLASAETPSYILGQAEERGPGGEGGGRKAAEPRGPGVGRSRGWSAEVFRSRSNGGLQGGTALGWDNPGASRSPPAHVTAPKYPTHFLPNKQVN